MDKCKVIKIATVISIFIMASFGVEGAMIENLNIPRALGHDIKKINEFTVDYFISLEVYTKSEKNAPIKIDTGIASTIGETRSDRQLKTDRKFLLGLEKIMFFNEQYARYGLKSTLDILINNPQINDNAFIVVCKQNCVDLMKFNKLQSKESASEYIYGMMKHLNHYNFFCKKYRVLDAVLKSSSEGVHLVVPYIEIKENTIKITGAAFFDKDKMLFKVNIDDMRKINLLKEKSAEGMLTVEENSKKYTSYHGKSKRKVNCTRQSNGRLKFDINLNMSGDIISNRMYEDFDTNIKSIERFKKDLEDKVERESYEVIDKMKNKYKIDMLNLGKIAAAKYGKNTGVNWDKEVCNSDIKVHAKINIENQGRGDY